jgi:hypothetical protein
VAAAWPGLGSIISALTRNGHSRSIVLLSDTDSGSGRAVR